MAHEKDHRMRALEAIDDAQQGTPEQAQSAQVYALTAIAEATLAVHDILIEVRDELERLRASK